MSFSLQPLGALAGQFLECSFRGVPFAVLGGGGRNGRKIALHDYPGRDEPWAEDLGRKGRNFRISGFMVGPLAYTQRDLLKAAVEQPGPGLLIHPSMGILRVSCLEFSWQERDGVMNVVDVQLEFIEQGELLGGLITTALHGVIAAGSMAFSGLAASGYVKGVSTFFGAGSTVSTAAATHASNWAAQATAHVNSPAVIPGAAAQISGENGRFLGNSGTMTADQALSSLSAVRASLTEAQARIGLALLPADLVQAVRYFLSILVTLIATPATLILILQPLAQPGAIAQQELPKYRTGQQSAVQAATIYTARLCHLLAFGTLCEVVSDWEPTSSDEAQTMLQALSAIADTLQLLIGQTDDDSTFQALDTLITTTAQDLSQRGARLPDIITIERPLPQPALTLAQQLYGDGTRGTDLVARVAPVHPAFMPSSFKTLSS